MFGTGMVWDAFLIAFMIPNLLRRLVGEGALSGSFIPVFTEYLERKSRHEAWRLASIIFSLLLVGLAVIVLLGMLGIGLVLNNFALPDKLALILRLTRVMLPYIFFISLAALAMGVLNSLKHFTAPAMAPIMLNLCWIGALFWLCPRFGDRLNERIWGLAIGVLIGGLFQLLIQIPALLKKGLKFLNMKFKLDIAHPAVRRIGLLMAPAALGLAITQINIAIDLVLAYLLGDGAVSALWYGNRLMQFPLGVFGIALGTALLPFLSIQVAREDLGRMKETFSFALRMACFIMLPAAVGLIVLRTPIIRLLFERGEFTSLSTSRTAMTLLFYCVGLCSYAGLKIVVPCFYSLQDTRTPVRVGAIAMACNVALNLILMWPLREGGLALATAISSTINLSILFWILKARIGDLGGRKIVSSFGRILCATTVMGVSCWFIWRGIFQQLKAPTVPLQLVSVLIPIFGGTLSFIVASYFFRVEEMRVVWGWISRKS